MKPEYRAGRWFWTWMHQGYTMENYSEWPDTMILQRLEVKRNGDRFYRCPPNWTWA